MKLTQEDADIIKYLGYPKKVNLSIGSYYIKKIKEKDLTRELIGSSLSSLFNLITPQYKVIKINQNYYLLSTDLNNIGEFKTAKDFGITDFINSSIYQVSLYLKINKKFNQSLESELISLYLFDLFLGNFDRHNGNWGFINNHNELHLGVLDNETILDEDYLNKEPYFKHFEGLTSYKGYIKTTIEDIDTFVKENFTFFLNNYPEYQSLVHDLLDKLTPEYLYNVIKSLATNFIIYTEEGEMPLEIPDALKLVEIYSYNYNLIKNIEREYSHAR